MPKRIKRRRPITTDAGLEVGMEEYYDYVFPDEAGAAPHLKLLEAAYRWKRQRVDGGEPEPAGPGAGAGAANGGGDSGQEAADEDGG